jgi:predicted Rossmann fold nucleotide-binding protein DprA/Smf involved in DNA uptake
MTKSIIKINPVTMKIEFEVSDSFLANYFEKLEKRFPKSKKLTPKIKSIKTKTKPEPKIKTVKGKKTKPVPKVTTVKKKNTKTPLVKSKRGFIQSGIFEIIKNGSDDGVSVRDIVESTGLEKKQVYNTIKILKSKRFIKTTGRGMYSVLETREEWTTPQDDFL